MALGIVSRSFHRGSPHAPTTIDGIAWDAAGIVTEGNRWYADKNASAGGDGKTWATAFNTMQAAIDAATAANNDVIYVARGTFTVTETVNFNKSGIAVIVGNPGLSPWASGEFTALLADATFTNGPVATITSPCYIEGLGFASRDTGATFFSGAAALIGGQATADPFGVHLKNCRFPKWGLDNRIGLAIEGSSDVLVETCIFEGVGANFASGIYVQGATQNLHLIGNVFHDCDAAITHGAFAGGGPQCVYAYNIAEDCAKFLADGGNAATGIIYKNAIEIAATSAYTAASAAALVALGLNPVGNDYVETFA